MRRVIQKAAILLLVLSLPLWGSIALLQYKLPNHYYVTAGEPLTLTQSYIQVHHNRTDTQVSSVQAEETVSLRLWNLFPVKAVQTTQREQLCLIPSGQLFGAKMFSDGVMIVGLEEIATESGRKCPGQKAGLQKGDRIVSINDTPITRNEQVASFVKQSGGSPLRFEIIREDSTLKTELEPVKSSEQNTYQSGLWVRDSAAGIGTITYIDPVLQTFAGLGHAICDIDTGDVIPVASGEICRVELGHIQKGAVGMPGELIGTFTNDKSLGEITRNCACGIFGTLAEVDTTQNTYPVAHIQEIHAGKAEILCSFDGVNTERYDIEILSLNYNEKEQVKNMVIKITDPKLLAITGGIVQGMSGTPILQDGKLIGAVTHVLVNDPTKGYGIFIENMLEAAA